MNIADEHRILSSLFHSATSLSRSQMIVLSALLKKKECTDEDFLDIGISHDYISNLLADINERLRRANAGAVIVSVPLNNDRRLRIRRIEIVDGG